MTRTEGIVTYTVSGQDLTRYVVTGLKPNATYEVRDLASNATQILSTESDVELWDYRGVASNVETGVLFFQTVLAGTHTYQLTPDH